MQLSDPIQSLIEYLSPSELLATLNTLQKIKQDQIRDFQLRYNHCGNQGFDELEEDDIDLELLQALKNHHQSSIKPIPQRSAIKKTLKINTQFDNFGSDRKHSLTPNYRNTLGSARLSESKSLRKKKLSEIKEFEIRNKQDRSLSFMKNKTLKPKTGLTPKYGLNNTCQWNKTQEKQVPKLKPRVHQPSTKAVQISTNSKKIMLEKQKKGQTYIPIQNRTSLLIKEKQQKIAKIQKRNEDKKQLENRQCTFKPQINSYRKAAHKQPFPKRSSNRFKTDSDLNQLQLSQIISSKNYEQEESMENFFGALTQRRDCDRSEYKTKHGYQKAKNAGLRNEKQNNYFGTVYG